MDSRRLATVLCTALAAMLLGLSGAAGANPAMSGAADGWAGSAWPVADVMGAEQARWRIATTANREVKINAQMVIATQESVADCSRCGPHGTDTKVERCSYAIFVQFPAVAGAASYNVVVQDKHPRINTTRNLTGPPFNDNSEGFKTPAGAHWFGGLTGGSGPAPCPTDPYEGGRFEILKAVAIFDDKARIVGNVKDADGNGVPGVRVTARGARTYSATAGIGGAYNMKVKKGRYAVSARPYCVVGAAGCKPSKTVKVTSGAQQVDFHLPYCPAGPPAVGAAQSGDRLDLSPKPVTVDRDTGGRVSLTATIKATCAVGARLVVDFLPIVSFLHRSQFDTTAPPLGTVIRPLRPRAKTQTVQIPGTNRGLKVAPVVVKPGYTIAGMNRWIKPFNPSSGLAIPGGGQLIYSDYPESLAPTTGLGSRGLTATVPSLGDEVEGILYKQPDPLTAAGAFRLHFNHENRTTRGKQICMVATNRGSDPVRLEYGPNGVAMNGGDPVRAGRDALLEYEGARRNIGPRRQDEIGAGDTLARCLLRQPQGLPAARGGARPVATGLFDLSTSGPLQIGLVAVNVKRAPAFEKEPTTFQFADASHAKGNPNRTYETDGHLFNSKETLGHVEGTFPYNEVSVPVLYGADGGERFAILLADNPARAPLEYIAALDDPGIRLTGNYGVRYRVTVVVIGTEGREVQVLLNPRGAGEQAGGFVNAYSGVVRVSGEPSKLLRIPAKMGKEDRVRCLRTRENETSGDKVTCNDKAVGVGIVKAGDTLTFEMIPPAGSTLPLALVLLPASIHVEGRVESAAGNRMLSASKDIPLRPDAP